MKNTMRKKLRFSHTLLILLVFLSADVALADSPKSRKLHRKIAEIESLQKSLNDKIAFAIEKRKEIIQQSSELEREIVGLADELELYSYQRAVQLHRIRFDLKLIHRLSDYEDKLAARIKYFQNGNETLDFYSQQIHDDLKLIKTLNDFQIEQLISRIDKAIRQYLPEIQKKLIVVEELKDDAPEVIWNRLTKKYSKLAKK
jgi:hypothetical protein